MADFEREEKMTTPNRMSDSYEFGGGKLVYLHFGQETPEEAEERQALLQRVAESLGVRQRLDRERGDGR